MPVLKAKTEYKTHSGKVRVIRLYKAWKNLNNRVDGHNYAGNGCRAWVGLPVAWETFADFRAWALANGYSKRRCSLDRIDSDKGYGPDNCRWLTRAQNTKWQNAVRYGKTDVVIEEADYADTF